VKLKTTHIAVGLSLVSMFALSGCGSANSGQNNATSVTQSNTSGSAPHKSFGGRGGNGGRFELGAISKELGMDTSTLMNDLKGGQSMAQIAQSKGISQQKLISDLESSYKTGLDQMVSSGRISASQEQQMISKYDNALPNLIQQKGMSAWMPRRGNSACNTTNSTSSNIANNATSN
jgi:hypothetical protein